MSRDRVKAWALAVIFGLFAVVLQSTALHGIFGEKMEASLIFGLILWLAFFKNNPDGVILAFFLAYLQGAVSGSLSGIFMLAGMSLYLVCFSLRDRFAPRTAPGQFLFALGLGFCYKLVLLLALSIFVGADFLRVQTPRYFALEIILNAVLAVLIFSLFNRIKGFFDLIPELVEPRRG